MTTKEFSTLAGQQTGTFLNPRLLGVLGMIGAPMILLEGLSTGFEQHGTDQLTAVLEVIYMTGWMSSMIGLGLSQATGQRWPGKAILGVQLFGLLIAALWAAYHLVTPNPHTEHILYMIGDAAWPLSHLFMNVVGIAVLMAKKWTDWRKFTPLACGLALPAFILSSMVGGEAMIFVFPIATTVAFGLLGYAVYTRNEA